MREDYGAPLGLDRAQGGRGRLPLWLVFVTLSVLIVAGMAVWAALHPDPLGGQPHVLIELPPPQPAPPAAAEPAPAPDAEPDDPDGQIIIRDP